MFKLPKKIGVVLVLGLLVHEWLSSFLPILMNSGVSLAINFPLASWVLGAILLLFLVIGRGWWLGLVWVGGMINWLDRVRFGAVRDYWQIGPINLYNNLADWIIFIGFIGYLWKKAK